MTQKIIVDGKDMTEDVKRELQRGFHAKMYHETLQQRRAAKVNGEAYNLSIGYKQFQIRPVFYHYWGKRLGYECWDDEQFVREILRDNPECRVKNVSRKPMVGYTGSKDIERTGRKAAAGLAARRSEKSKAEQGVVLV